MSVPKDIVRLSEDIARLTILLHRAREENDRLERLTARLRQELGAALGPNHALEENERLRAILRYILVLVGDRERGMGQRMKEIGFQARTALGRDDTFARQVGTDRRPVR